MKKISQFAAASVFVASLFAPLIAAAQTGINIGAITPYTTRIIDAINNVFVPLLIAIAFIVFLYGVYKYFILGAAEEAAKGEGRQFVMWGIIGFVVILSLWALVGIVRDTFGLTTGNSPTPPTFTPGR